MNLEQLETNLSINKGDYNSMVSIAVLFKKLYGRFPKIGLSGQQAEFASELLLELPDLEQERADSKVTIKILSEELPKKNQIVWCLRKWVPIYIGISGKEKSEWVLATRKSNKPLITTGDISSNCYWSDVNSGSMFNDQTVYGWVALKAPEIEI